MRKLSGIAALLAAGALVFGTGAMTASADPGNGNGNGKANGQAVGGNSGNGSNEDPNGSNGTVKVHEWPEHKNGSEMANDPKVCQFELHGFKFDGGQSGRWWIQDHKWGNGDASQAVLSGTYASNSEGDWTSGPYKLADGHYKLYVELTHTAGNSGKTVTTYKHKVFKVECPTSGGSNNGGSNNGGSENGGSNTGGSNNGGGETGTTRDTQTAGNTVVYTETTTVVENGERFQVIRIFNNGILVNESRTSLGAVAGFESAPAGQPAGTTAPAELAALGSLPATSTAPDLTLSLLGAVMTTIGAAMLRRPRRG